MLKDLRQTRIDKLNNLAKAGFEVYPEKSQKDYSNKYALENFDNLLDKEIFLIGRIRSLRQMGVLIFFTLKTRAGKSRRF